MHVGESTASLVDRMRDLRGAEGPELHGRWAVELEGETNLQPKYLAES